MRAPASQRVRRCGTTAWSLAACFSPDGTLAATASADKTARLWDGYDGSPVALPLKHQDVVRSVSFSPEGQRVVTASQDHTARVWDAHSGDPLIEPMRHSGPVWSAEFSSDARQVLTASSDQTARLWDVRPGQALGHILPSTQAVSFRSVVAGRSARAGIHA